MLQVFSQRQVTQFVKRLGILGVDFDRLLVQLAGLAAVTLEQIRARQFPQDDRALRIQLGGLSQLHYCLVDSAGFEMLATQGVVIKRFGIAPLVLVAFGGLLLWGAFSILACPGSGPVGLRLGRCVLGLRQCRLGEQDKQQGGRQVGQ